MFFCPSLRAYVECLVVHEADTAEYPGELLRLALGGVEAVLERTLHDLRHASFIPQDQPIGAYSFDSNGGVPNVVLRATSTTEEVADKEGG